MKIKHLDAFEIFSELDEKTKILASRLISVDGAKQGCTLFRLGENDELEYFLVSGEVELIAEDGVTKRLNANDSAAQFPLALLRPRKFSAKVVSEYASFIKIKVETLRRLRHCLPVVGDEVTAFSIFSDSDQSAMFSQETDTDAIKKFLLGASKAIKDNRLDIANFDDVSHIILNVIRDPQLSVDALVSAIQLDASISAKIIRAANSAFYGGLAKVDSVRSAIVRLGISLSSELISVMVLKEVFSSEKENLQTAMHQLWSSSLKLATYSTVVGRRSRVEVEQGQSLLAGLMNEIGSLAIITYLDQFPSTMKTITEQVLASTSFKKKLGVELLTHWEFPESIISVVQNSDDFARDIEQGDLCDIVCVAKLLIRMTSYRKLPFDDISETPSFKRLGFDEKNSNLINEIQEEALKYTQLFTA